MLWLLLYSCSKCWDLTSNWCRAIFIINFNNVLLYWDGKSLFLKLEQESRSSVPIRRYALAKYTRQESFLTTRIRNDIKPGSVYTSDILDELIQKKNCRCFIKKDNIVECKLFFSHRQVIHNCCRQDFFDTTIIVFSWANPTFGICLDAESAVILFLVSIFLAHYFLMWKYKLCKRKNRRALQNYPPSDSEGGLSKVSKIVGEYCYYHHWHLGLILFWKFKIFQTRPNN